MTQPYVQEFNATVFKLHSLLLSIKTIVIIKDEGQDTLLRYFLQLFILSDQKHPPLRPLRAVVCDSQRLNAPDVRAHGARNQHPEDIESTCPAIAGRRRIAIYDWEESSYENTNYMACDHCDIAAFCPRHCWPSTICLSGIGLRAAKMCPTRDASISD